MASMEFIVTGLVQGVGYRYYVLRHASRLGLKGFVRNMRDGSVQVVAQGDDALLATLEELLARGPSLARVTGLEKRPYTGPELQAFDVAF
jgi:acylphosphatase